MVRIVCPYIAREIWFRCPPYDAQKALDMGQVNTVVPVAVLEKGTARWCSERLQDSQVGHRCLKSSLHPTCVGQARPQERWGNATMLSTIPVEWKRGRASYTQSADRTFG